MTQPNTAPRAQKPLLRNEFMPLEKTSVKRCLLMLVEYLRAGYETRTRDFQLGKLTLYQLS